MTPREVAEMIRGRFEFTYARSGGPGGQNVNKVETKVVARLPLDALAFLPEDRRWQVEARLSNRITMDREILLSVQDTREQARNREIAVERMAELIARAMLKPKRRLKTRPSKAAREARLRAKKTRSAHKRMRGLGFEE